MEPTANKPVPKNRNRIGLIIFLALTLLFIGVVRNNRKNNRTQPSMPGTQSIVPPPESSDKIAGIRLLTENGGRVAWYKGNSHDLIAYDSVSNKLNKNTEVYTLRPDGTERFCVTCKSDVPKGFVGQPSWHPNGEYLVVQAENSNSKHRLFNHLAWGINQDLWLVRRDGSEAVRLWESALNHGALHPHFSPDGRTLVFAERIATGNSLFPVLRTQGADGENQWDGWQIHFADFNAESKTLSNHRTYRPNGTGLYETHGFGPNGRSILYSYTKNGLGYVDDVYQMAGENGAVVNLTNSPSTWDEHGTFLPSGELIFMSSRAFPDWQAPRDNVSTLRTELFMKDTDGEIVQLTDINGQAGNTNRRILVSDFDIDRDGKRIVFQGTPADGGDISVWIIELR